MTDAAWVEVPFEVQLPQAGLRVDRFLADRLHRYSRAEVQRLITAGRVFLRGRTAKPAVRVAHGDRVVIRYPKREEPEPRHAAFPVLFEDERVLAINKPGDVLSHPTDKVLRNAVTSILRAQFPGKKLHLVHRLDRETSGALLLAKDPEAARELVRQFTHRLIQKEYVALAAGRMASRRRTVSLALGREGREIKVRQAAVAEGTGASATTEFEVLAASENASLVRALPRTGRLHQIRVHLASLGHPVLGDKLYTGEGEAYLKACRHVLSAEDLQALGAPRQMLHARRLAFLHPATGKLAEVSAPPPQDFLDCLEAAGLPRKAAEDRMQQTCIIS